MEFLILTKTNAFLGPIADLLGIIMNGLFKLTSMFGIFNIGLCIILFTLVTKLLLFPLTLKQQKSSKLMSVMQPEIQAIQKKYKGKQDQESMMKMNVETKAVYEKYGTSMTGGCLPMLIQLPIMFALYQVIYRIPAYVTSIRHYFDLIIAQLPSGYTTSAVFTKMAEAHKLVGIDYSNVDKVVDLLYKLTDHQWAEMAAAFPGIADVVTQRGENVIGAINKMQQFLGMNIAYTPMNTIMDFFQGGSDIRVIALICAVLIPILSGATQFYSTKLMTTTQPQAPDAPGGGMMKAMTTTMPLMSIVFCFSFPLVIGIYWVAGSVFQVIQQLCINAHLNKVDIDVMIQKNVEKANKKRAKKGLPPTKINQNASASLKNIQAAEEKEEAERIKKIEKTKEIIKDSNEYYNKDAKPGSLASKAAMVQKYNEKHNK